CSHGGGFAALVKKPGAAISIWDAARRRDPRVVTVRWIVRVSLLECCYSRHSTGSANRAGLEKRMSSTASRDVDHDKAMPVATSPNLWQRVRAVRAISAFSVNGYSGLHCAPDTWNLDIWRYEAWHQPHGSV